MEILTLMGQNLLSPAILFFILGMGAGFIKSDLSIPESTSRFLSLYLMIAIGLKGGVALVSSGGLSQEMLLSVAAGIGFGLLQPVLGFAMLRATTKLDRATAAAVAAHYGSVSLVTFATAISFLKLQEVAYAGYMVAVLALMEAPAIVSGLWLAGRKDETLPETPKPKPQIWHHVLTNGAVVLLFGTFLIGMAIGTPGLTRLEGLLVIPYQGILCLFLLDMGLLVARKLKETKSFSLPLIAFGIYMPVIGASFGLGCSRLIGLDVGSGFLFTILCASASYIAVPAAMRMALPKANPGVYVPMSLAISFPFNIGLGLPVYYALCQYFL
jgi:uncharacterized protein